MTYNYVIIEDQKGAFNNLRTALKQKTGYKFSGHATNKDDAIILIMKKQPDLIFMDVELGNATGFDVISDLKNACFVLPPIIMTTAHDSYAKRAVNNQIAYFLSKPICYVELVKALTTFEKRYACLHNQLFIRSGKKLEVVKYEDIIYLEADAGYTRFTLDNGRIISVAKSLKHFEVKLNESFLRVHRSYIINIQKIKEIKLTERICILESSTQCNKIEIGKNQIIHLRSKLKV